MAGKSSSSRRSDEVTDRLRRIETKVTQIAVGAGIRTDAQKPQFSFNADGVGGTVELPSPHSSVKEIIDSLPQNWHGSVMVNIGGDQLVSLTI